MKGIVKYINPLRGMVAVLTDEGQYSVFELLGGEEIDPEDIVTWSPDTALGGKSITNHTRNERYEVYFQNHYVQSSQLRQQLLL